MLWPYLPKRISELRLGVRYPFAKEGIIEKAGGGGVKVGTIWNS